MITTSAMMKAAALPWGAFVAAFLYYTALTLITIGVGELSGVFVAVTYLVPVALYGVVLVSRGLRALAAVQIDIGHTPQALLR